MPTPLFTPKVSKKMVDHIIIQATSLLANIEQTKKETFLFLLEERISDFKNSLSDNKISLSEKDLILEQYSRFAKTLYQCLQHPKGAAGSINFYFNKQYYHPVGITEIQPPEPTTQNITKAAAGIGMAILASSTPAFVFNPAIGALLFAIAITLLFPSCLTLLSPDSLDTTKKQEEETMIFLEGALLLKPDLLYQQNTREDYSPETEYNL